MRLIAARSMCIFLQFHKDALQDAHTHTSPVVRVRFYQDGIASRLDRHDKVLHDLVEFVESGVSGASTTRIKSGANGSLGVSRRELVGNQVSQRLSGYIALVPPTTAGGRFHLFDVRRGSGRVDRDKQGCAVPVIAESFRVASAEKEDQPSKHPTGPWKAHRFMSTAVRRRSDSSDDLCGECLAVPRAE